MTADRSVSVVLKAQVEGYVSPMKKAEAATKTLDDRVKATVKSHQMMARAAEVAGTIGALAIGKKLVGAASDLNETMSKTSVVFGKNSDAVVAWSKTSAEAMGMSQQQAAEAAATFGNLFVALKLGGKQSADMSTKLVQLAGDLASFNNVDPAVALDALRSGLVGETEPLRKFGVNMNDATLTAEAMKLGLIDHKVQALDPAIKAQAAYALILDQTKTAQGDFARTSTGLANSQRIFTAEVQNAQAALGNALLPAVNGSVHGLTQLLSVFNDLPDPIKNTVVVTGALSAALAIAAPRLLATKTLLAETGVTAKGAAVGLGAAAAALAAITAERAGSDWLRESNGAVVKGGDQAATTLKGLRDVSQLTDSSFHQLGATTYNLKDMLDQTFNRSMWDNVKNSTNVMEHLGISQDQVDEFDRFAKSADAGLSTLIAKGGPAADSAKSLFGSLSAQMTASGATADQIAAAFPMVTAAIQGTTAATGAYASTTTDASRATDDLKTSIDKLTGTAMSADEATSNLEAAIDDATKAVKDNGKGLDLHTAKGRANDAALRSLAQSALAGVSAWQANGQGAKQVAAHTQEARDAFIDTATKMGLTRTAAKKLADSYGLIPKDVRTAVNLAGNASAQLDAIAKKIRDLRQTVKVQVTASGTVTGTGGGRTLGNAGGGLITGPGTKTSDSILRRVSTGEFVQRAAAVDKYGVSFMNAVNAGTWSQAQATVPVPVAAGFVPAQRQPDILITNITTLDGQVVATSLRRLKRSQGGVSLGLG